MQYHRLVRIALGAIALLGFMSGSAAAPIVGTANAPDGLTDGMTLVIGGSGFDAKTIAKPLLWADFNVQLQPIAALGQRSSWDGIAGTLNTVVRAPNAGQSMRFDHSSSSNAVMGIEDIRDASGQRTQNLYMFARKYYDFDIFQDKRPPDATYPDGTFNLKMYRFWGDLGGAQNNIHWSYQGAFGTDSGAATAENTDTNFRGAYYSDIIDQKEGQWLVHELIYDAGTQGPDPDTTSAQDYLNSADGIYDLFEDGVKWTNNTVRFVTHDQNQPLKYEDFYFDQVSNGTAAGPQYVYYDEVYVDTTLQRVIICDADTFANCTKRAIQIPSSWTDNQIQVTLNRGEFGSFNQPLWLYVFDAAGEPNATGLPLICEDCDDSICFPAKAGEDKYTLICL